MTSTYYAAAFLGTKTAAYRPAAFGAGWGLGSSVIGTTQGQMPFHVSEVPMMLTDPMVSFALRILRAPLAGARWKINANSPEVKLFVHRQLRRFWRRDLDKACRMLEYGVAGGELTYRPKGGKIVFDCLKELHPFDLRPLRNPRDGSFCGVRVQPMAEGGKPLDLAGPRAFWIANAAKYGQFYGKSRLAGAWEPWLEKRGKRGAADIRRTWFLKNAYRGARLRYPHGRTLMPDGRERDNQEIARELVEKAESGFVLALPGARDQVSGEYLWSWEDAQSHGDVSGVREYYGDLNDEILVGTGIPVELVRAGETGSGYAGRAVPAQVFYRSEDEIVANIIDTVDRLMLRPLVLLNFGEQADYEIEPESLAEMLAQDQQAGQPGRAPVAPLPTGGRGGSNYIPSPSERSPHRMVNPETGQYRYKNTTMQRDMATRRFSRGLPQGFARIRLGRKFHYGWHHAPRGGVTINGKKYKGGEFIPNEELDKASEEDLAAYESAKEEATAADEKRYLPPKHRREHQAELMRPLVDAWDAAGKEGRAARKTAAKDVIAAGKAAILDHFAPKAGELGEAMAGEFGISPAIAGNVARRVVQSLANAHAAGLRSNIESLIEERSEDDDDRSPFDVGRAAYVPMPESIAGDLQDALAGLVDAIAERRRVDRDDAMRRAVDAASGVLFGNGGSNKRQLSRHRASRRQPPRPLVVAERIRMTAAQLADSFFAATAKP